MTKDHRRGHREVRKPKKDKEVIGAPAGLIKAPEILVKTPKKLRQGHEHSYH
jgi:hypothetical protein